jgi:hypothetical protein
MSVSRMRLLFCDERCIGIPLYCTNMIDSALFKAYQSTKFIVCAPPRDVVLAIGGAQLSAGRFNGTVRFSKWCFHYRMESRFVETS